MRAWIGRCNQYSMFPSPLMQYGRDDNEIVTMKMQDGPFSISFARTRTQQTDLMPRGSRKKAPQKIGHVKWGVNPVTLLVHPTCKFPGALLDCSRRLVNASALITELPTTRLDKVMSAHNYTSLLYQSKSTLQGFFFHFESNFSS